MRLKKLSIPIVLAGMVSFGFNNPNPEMTGMNNKNSVDEKVEALLAKMTLEEKIGQMMQVDIKAFDSYEDVKKYYIGSVLSGGDSDPGDISATGWRNLYDELQGYALQTRLKIPMIYGIDAVHGHNNVQDAVIFPHNVALGATRNAGLTEKAAKATAEEIAATGMDWTFAPCVAVARNERWGRTYESFGETPELNAELGAAYVKGLQRDFRDETSVIACAKHFLGDGGTTNGIDQGNTEVDEAELRKIHLPGYIAAIKADVKTIMVSYSSWNGRKMHGNRYLLTDVLKKELGFKGFLISDWAAIDQLSPDFKYDIEASINAGLDMIMIPNGSKNKNNYVEFFNDLKELVAEKKVSMERIDDAVRRILKVKFESGIFEQPYSDKNLMAGFGSDEHREVARECVRQSLVLLKNENHALPVSKKIKTLHVAGKNADNIANQCGGWTINWQSLGDKTIKGTTVLQAIKNTVSKDTKVTYSADASGSEGADMTIVVIGETPYAEMKGDKEDLALSQEDVTAIKNAKKAGKPVVCILLSGRPMIISRVLGDCDASVAAWLPGTEGQGVADVIFGDHNFTGRLPHSWPKDMSQVPVNYGDKNYAPLFQYGYGLMY